MIALAGRVVEELVNKLGRGSDLADTERWFTHALKSEGKRTHVRDLACHQELQSIPSARITAEIYQPFVHNLGPCFRGDIATEVHVKLPRDLQVISRPRIA